MRRQEFTAGLSTTAIWPLAARAQQPAKIKLSASRWFEQPPKGQVHSVGWCGLQRLPRYPQSNSAFGHEPLDPRYDRPDARQMLEVRMDDQPHFTRKNGLGAA